MDDRIGLERRETSLGAWTSGGRKKYLFLIIFILHLIVIRIDSQLCTFLHSFLPFLSYTHTSVGQVAQSHEMKDKNERESR